jgi:riboflavin synthase
LFTGIIQEVARVVRFDEAKGKRRLTIAAENAASELKIGDSVAVSGACLTAVDIAKNTFAADLAGETVARTSLSRLQPGSLVNLELPLRATDRMGGHYVQGHVDGTGRLAALEKVVGGEDFWLSIEVPADVTRYIVEKGSIAIEGISLTVARIEGARVAIAIIPHTYEATNLKSLRPGDPVNVEADILAKYLAKWMHRDGAGQGVTVEDLVRQGF